MYPLCGIRPNGLPRVIRSVLLGRPGTGVLIQVAETLGFCGDSPSVRIRLGCCFGLDTLAQQRILLAVAGSKFKAPVWKAVQRTNEREVAGQTEPKLMPLSLTCARSSKPRPKP